MAPRDPSRPKASDIDDVDILVAVERYTDTGAPHPNGTFEHFPMKVVSAKLDKLVRRGLINSHLKITPVGRKALGEMQERAS